MVEVCSGSRIVGRRVSRQWWGARRSSRPREPVAHCARPRPAPCRLIVAVGRIVRRRRPPTPAPRRQVVPGRRPLPDVADHVEQPVAVGSGGFHRRRADPAVGAEVLEREAALPGVGRSADRPGDLLPPREGGRVQPAAAALLELDLGGQRLACPARAYAVASRWRATCATAPRMVEPFLIDGPGPWGCATDARGGSRARRWRQSLEWTGPGVGVNTSAPGASFLGRRVGGGAGSSGRSATVT